MSGFGALKRIRGLVFRLSNWLTQPADVVFLFLYIKYSFLLFETLIYADLFKFDIVDLSSVLICVNLR